MVKASWVWSLPKAELHLHLDTSLRPSTALELGPKRGVKIETEEDLVAPHDCHSLVECLKSIDPAIAILQDVESLQRCAQELAEDICTDGVVYAEIRFAPQLHTKRGLTMRQVIESVWKGFGYGQYKSVRVRLILCALRHETQEQALALAKVALESRDLGVVAFDLAGDENAQPASVFAKAFSLVREQGLGAICHAGEAAGPSSIRDALDQLGATRIGHGVRAISDPALMNELKIRGIFLENCPSSNVITKAVSSLEQHPMAQFLKQGMLVTINTDARTLIRTTMTDEMTLMARHHRLNRHDLCTLMINGFKGGFDVGPNQMEWINYLNGESKR